MEIEEIAREVVDSGYKIHVELGPGSLEGASIFKNDVKRIVHKHPDFAASRAPVAEIVIREEHNCQDLP